MKNLNLGLRFLLEIAMLAAFAIWGFRTGGSPVMRVLLGVGVPLLVAVIWGAFIAPRARWPVPLLLRLVMELVLFGLAAVALAAAGSLVPALVLGVLALLSSLINYYYERRGR